MIEAVDVLLERWTRPGSPGCAVAVVQDGAVLHRRGYGFAHVELDVPNAPDTVFRIASVTKQFTCLAVLMLAREGKLSVEDEARRHLPELPDYGAPLRIRHLMSSTGGLRDSLEAFRLTGITLMDRRSVAEMLALILRQEATNFPPGASYLYSNAGYVLLTVLVERLSGMSLRDFLDTRIFKPLGMAATALLPYDAEPFPRRAQGYAPVEGALWRAGSGFELCGEGGMVSSVEDMIRWTGIWGSGTHPDLDPLIHLAGPAPLSGGGHARYGYGFMAERYRGLAAYGHSGLLPGFTSNILHIPERRLSVICLANSLGVNSYLTTRLVADLAPGVDFPEPPLAMPDPGLIDRLAQAGPYVDAESGATLTFNNAEGRLGATRYGTPFLLANADGGAAYRVLQGGYDVVSADIAEEPAIAIRLTRVDGGVETYRPVAAEQTGADQTGADRLDEYIGRYRSAELMSDWVIERAADGLAVRIEGPRGPAQPCPLEPTRPDLLTARIGWFGAQFRDALRFRRQAGRVAGFTLNAARSRGIRFVAVTN